MAPNGAIFHSIGPAASPHHPPRQRHSDRGHLHRSLDLASLAGTVAANDGTKFNVLFSSGSDSQDNAEYRIIAGQKGFDREGNPIDRHCQLELFDAGDSEASKTLLVLNAGSGHVLGPIPLPAQLPLY